MIQIPETYDQMRRLPYAVRRELWARYSPHPFVRQNMALWYYIQCDRLKLRILPKHMVKIRKYMTNPDACLTHVYRNKYNMNVGTIISKTFRNITHTVTVGDNNTLIYHDKTYRSLSAIAREITGIKISGPDFFGLSTRGKNDNQ